MIVMEIMIFQILRILIMKMMSPFYHFHLAPLDFPKVSCWLTNQLCQILLSVYFQKVWNSLNQPLRHFNQQQVKWSNNDWCMQFFELLSIKKLLYTFFHSTNIYLAPYYFGTTIVFYALWYYQNNISVHKTTIFFSVCILPMFHAFGLFVTSLPTLHVGGKIVTLPTFEPNSFLKAVENTKVRSTFKTSKRSWKMNQNII